VLPRRSWTAKALAAVVRHALATAQWAKLVTIVEDAFFLRRALVLEVVARAATLAEPGSLEPVRPAIDKAWSVRHQLLEFAREDRKVIPLVLDSVGMLASMWLLNSLGDSYLAVMATVPPTVSVPERYVPSHLALLDAIEAGDPSRARRELGSYLDELDEQIVMALPEELRQLLRGPRQARSGEVFP
jgi:DNA-binding FadR family transcriptional regulator